MDTESVTALATTMADVAQRVRAMEARLSQGLSSTDWVGNDRNRFESDWTAQHVVALRQAAEALDDAARVAHDQVQQQDRASA
ncbi:hypothetical protein [Nocardioides plantarum]|uniref:WXG100 family type VII secretion target n=1 Tax=Nocardioides plantarum TaxID=29299 RepID=A0ABV5K9U9_9ACTN|nr:hypothetical protein [Nocardioides plantarum]